MNATKTRLSFWVDTVVAGGLQRCRVVLENIKAGSRLRTVGVVYDLSDRRMKRPSYAQAQKPSVDILHKRFGSEIFLHHVLVCYLPQLMWGNAKMRAATAGMAAALYPNIAFDLASSALLPVYQREKGGGGQKESFNVLPLWRKRDCPFLPLLPSLVCYATDYYSTMCVCAAPECGGMG